MCSICCFRCSTTDALPTATAGHKAYASVSLANREPERNNYTDNGNYPYYSEALDADYSRTIYAYLYDLENAFLGSGYDCITWNTADMTDIENVTTTRSTTSGNIHDLSGRKLSTVSAAKGIYIRNGKKYVR